MCYQVLSSLSTDITCASLFSIYIAEFSLPYYLFKPFKNIWLSLISSLFITAGRKLFSSHSNDDVTDKREARCGETESYQGSSHFTSTRDAYAKGIMYKYALVIFVVVVVIVVTVVVCFLSRCVSDLEIIALFLQVSLKKLEFPNCHYSQCILLRTIKSELREFC